jgi:hypothetical protein
MMTIYIETDVTIQLLFVNKPKNIVLQIPPMLAGIAF